jgi:hypothetical protein
MAWRDPMKEMKAREMSFKQPQNEVKLNPKWTQKTKGIKPECNTRGNDNWKNKVV